MAVYFLGVGEKGPIKIGYTRGKVKDRISSLQVGCPDDLILLTIVDGDQELERELHDLFADYRIRGEWFERVDELLDFIEDTAYYEILYEMRQTGIKNPARLIDQ